MAGHSQFKNIMYRKGAQDAKKAKIFAKISREIMVAAKTGLPDPNFNPRLRSALACAREANMPNDNIDRALKKAIGDGDGHQYESMRYEGYGPNGIAFIIETLTDNRNRTASEIRSIFSKHGGNLGETGSVTFLFEHLGFFFFKKEKSFDDIFQAAIEADADHVEEDDDGYAVYCKPESFQQVREKLINVPGLIESKLIFKPLTPAYCDDLHKILDAFEDNDDVQQVYSNGFCE